MKKIFVFGNGYLSYDSMGIKVAEKLDAKAEFIKFENPDSLLDVKENEIMILDTIKDIKKPVYIDDISKIRSRNIVTLHDFDLGFFLNLMDKIGVNKKIRIIGVPEKGNINKISNEVERWI